MNRFHRIGLIVSAILFVVAGALPATGKRVADDALKNLRGGALRYCSFPCANDDGCNVCRFVQQCDSEVEGIPITYPTYSRCTATFNTVLCFDQDFGTMSPSPTCDAGVRNQYCGTGVYYSGYADCSNGTYSSEFLCGNVIDYSCIANYSASTYGPPAYGVNCTGTIPGIVW